MKILLERRSLQGEAHLEREEVRGERLTTFLASLEVAAGAPPRWSEGTLDAEPLAHADVFIVPTKLTPYAEDERDVLDDFVRAGGGLWVLSNHDPFHESDGLLLERFGVRLEAAFLRTEGSTTAIGGEHLKPHAVLDGEGGKVGTLVTNTTCSIRSEKGRIVALLPETMADKHTGDPPRGGLYAHALDGTAGDDVGKGRVLTVADSGFLGDRTSRIPGPGQIEEGDNILFVRNAVNWLAGL
ncbi:MAG: hypothetical protein ACYS47_05575 [Planctomycetota bacterium]|jgi:hypothetical protein